MFIRSVLNILFRILFYKIIIFTVNIHNGNYLDLVDLRILKLLQANASHFQCRYCA